MNLHQTIEFIMSEVDRHFPVIHVLRAGYPLCGFNLALPERWPSGHKWISCLDENAMQKTTCDDCRETLKAEQS